MILIYPLAFDIKDSQLIFGPFVHALACADDTVLAPSWRLDHITKSH